MADEKKVSGKTRAGTTAKPFPWEEAIGEQYERTKSRLKGLATEPEAELQRILDQYLPNKSDSPEDRMQKLEDLAMGFAGTTKLPTPKLGRASGLVGTPEQRAVEQGYMDYLHGTQRLDRLLEGKSFDPKRATSGPMPFGTTNAGRELASSYAMGKPDTSRIAEDFGEMKNYFQVLPKDIGLSGRNLMSAEDSWRFLPKEKQAEILDKAKRIGYRNPQEATGEWVLHKGSEGMPFSESHWNFVLNKESGGNPLTALRKVYAESGTLDPYAPSELADIYRLAGFNAPISQVNAPWTEAKGVFLGKARITNPLNTTDIDVLQNKVIPALKEEFKNDRTRKKPFGADQWDKNVRFTPKEWVDELERDIAASKNSYVWTSIPDKVTKALKDKLGYNGIIDASGKGGTGTPYPVVIPFEPGQIRSRFAAFDPEKIGKPDLLAAAVPVGLLGSTQVDLPKKQEKNPAPQVKKAEGGLAQYGVRHSGEGVKGKGYFGPMAGREGTVTELSAEDESGEFPLVVPTLTAEELELLLAGKDPTAEMMEKASSWAATRRKRGESPFASPTEVRMPRPKAEGGSVNLTDLPDEVTPANWREHLQNNVLADARALLGVKDGGVINLDELIEKSLKKKDGGVINLDELIDWTLAKAEHRKMKEGGAVKMADGGQTFPLQRPEEVTDLKPRPRTKRDELLEMLSKGVGSVHEFMAKPFGYENPPGEMVSSLIGLPGAAKTLERMAYGDPLTSGAGMTTNLLPETTEAAMLALGAAPTVLKATKNLPVGLSIKPTDMLDMELASKMKADKIKAPANPVGFYNPAEKAALNLQRKKGPGSAFISDMKKQPGVTDERLAELGLTDLASNPNLTREEVIAATEQNRIPLRESVRRPYQESDEYSETADALKESIRYREGGIQQVQAELDRVRATAPDSPLVQQYERKIETMRESIARDQQKLEAAKPSLYGPDSHPDYNMPGGENYREIRVGLPNTQKQKEIHEWFDPKTQTSKQFATQEEAIADKGKPASAYIMKRYEMEGAEPFYHKTHHGDEPNVLFHLRVADHVDEEGKRGLLIDELQSDWHQAGREKGYRLSSEKTTPMDAEYRALVHKNADAVNAGKTPDPKDVARAKQLEEELIKADKSNIPDAPFKDNWYQLGLKRAIKEAADTGMDRVYLTTGARQADRYDLSKHIDRIDYNKNPDGSYNLSAIKNGTELLAKEELTLAEVEQLVGKDMAKKMTAGEGKSNVPADRWEPEDSEIPQYKTLSGLDLKVGGEGMRQYYDKTYKNYLEKYAKKHGGKLGMTKIAEGEPVYYIDITDAMRDSAKKGQSYAFGGGVFNTDPDITDSGRIIPHNI
jgi:hypothetical protein